MLGPLPPMHRSLIVSLLVGLGALAGLFVAVDTHGLPATLGMLAGAGTGALLAMVADGTRPEDRPEPTLRHVRWRH